MVTDGPTRTRAAEALVEGRYDKPMPQAAVEKAMGQAAAMLESILQVYARDVAPGEVGAGGSARASQSKPLSGSCPTGLLYGRIQSGKTLGMISLTALAFDNGFRVVIVMTSDNVKLVDQTYQRFQNVETLLLTSTEATTWGADAEHMKKNAADQGLVVVCSKNQSQLGKLVEFLQSIGAADYPALVLDDEADQATLDTNLKARTSGRKGAPTEASTINRKLVQNDREGELGDSIRQVLRHHIFIQVTATPYALLLQNSDSALRPKFTKLLEPGQGYTGGESFFLPEHLQGKQGKPPLVFVSETESQELDGSPKVPPAGLAKAAAFFLVAAGAQAIVDPVAKGKGQNFLCHTSQKRADHNALAELLRSYVDGVLEALKKPILDGQVQLELEAAYQELQRTLPASPPLDAIMNDLRSRLPKRKVIVVNSDGNNATFGRGLNFIVGGNILGRGLTIENLLVTYYMRKAKISQMDTMLQHARMFGYRQTIMPYTRAYLPSQLARRFMRIHQAEQNLRALLVEAESRHMSVPVEVGGELRATRPGVLDSDSVLAIVPGHHLYPGAPLVTGAIHMKHEAAKREVSRHLAHVPSGKDQTEEARISFEDMKKIIDLVPFEAEDEDVWDPEAFKTFLDSNSSRYGGSGILYVRTMRREAFSEGALSGPELTSLRKRGTPVLCVFFDIGRKYELPDGSLYDDDFVYPSLVIPKDETLPAHVFNTSR